MNHPSVLFLSHYFGKNPGNFIPSLLALEEQLSLAASFRVVYGFPDVCREFHWCREMLQAQKPVYFYPADSRERDLAFLENIVKTEHVVLIHTHFEAMGRAIYRFRLKNRKIPVVWHKHNDFSLGMQSRSALLKRRLKDFVVDRLVTTVAVSPHLKTPGGHVLLNHLVSERIPTLSSAERTEVRRSLGLSDSDIMVLMFGWDKHRKGVDIGCRMLDHLPQPLIERCKLCVILEDTAENRAYAAEHCTAPRNVLLLDQTDDIFSYHIAADLMLSAARSEAFAYTILEALAVGTSVVSSDIPGVRWSKAYENVHFFRSEDPEDCARAVREAISGMDSLRSGQISARVREDFAIEKWCGRLLDLYQSTGALKS